MTEEDEVIVAFMRAINDMGGIIVDEDGEPLQVKGVRNSADLASAYLLACAVSGDEENVTVRKARR